MEGPHRARGPPQGGVALPTGAAGPGHTHHRGRDGRGLRCRGWQCAQGGARPPGERGQGAHLPAIAVGLPPPGHRGRPGRQPAHRGAVVHCR
eukprot:4327874-Alexandrium_andersonii.AAC.1